MKRDWTLARAKVEDEGSCRVCGAGAPEAAHLIARAHVAAGRGGEDDRNIVPLCRRHHHAFDFEGFDLLPFLALEEQAYAVSLVGLMSALQRLTGTPNELVP